MVFTADTGLIGAVAEPLTRAVLAAGEHGEIEGPRGTAWLRLDEPTPCRNDGGLIAIGPYAIDTR